MKKPIAQFNGLRLLRNASKRDCESSVWSDLTKCSMLINLRLEVISRSGEPNSSRQCEAITAERHFLFSERRSIFEPFRLLVSDASFGICLWDDEMNHDPY
jgi:hypothetical protein